MELWRLYNMIMNVIQPIDDELIVIESDEDGLFEDGQLTYSEASYSFI